jgi:trehalose 6-phosphate synthase/phosphatase
MKLPFVGICLPSADGVKYRYCIFSGGKFNRWESGEDSYRTLDTIKVKGFNRSVEDKFGDLTHRFSTNDSSLIKLAQTSTAKADTQRAKVFASWNPMSLKKDEIGPEDAVIMVSYFLPIILSKTKTGHWQAIWDKEALLSLQIDARLLWIGSIRYANAPIAIEEEEAVASLLQTMNCYPIFINQTMHYQFYDIFCKQNLWLVLHHVADVYGQLNQNEIGAKAQQNLWFNYSIVHKLFREKVLEVYQSSYLIWIHGFHLLLLPNFLRRRIPLAKIGYYFHTPFPSSELWRTMARREDLLRGILGANQIGFHLFEYARHFLTVCHRILGYSYDINASGMMTINVDGREVVITCIHVGVDMPRVIDVFESSTFVSEVKAWKERFGNRVVVSGEHILPYLSSCMSPW